MRPRRHRLWTLTLALILLFLMCSVVVLGGQVRADDAEQVDQGYCLEDNPGEIEWTRYTESAIVAVGPDGTVYIGSSFTLIALDGDGHIKWNRTLSGDCGSLMVRDDGVVIVGEYAHRWWQNKSYSVIALSPSGDQLWSYSMVGTGFDRTAALGEDGEIALLFRHSNLSEDGSYLKITNSVVVLDSDGSLLWMRYFDSYSINIACGHDGTVYLVQEGWVEAYDSNGSSEWRLDVGLDSPIFVAPDGTLRIAGNDKVISITQNGNKSWEAPIEGALGYYMAINENGDLFVTCTDRIAVINARGEWTMDIPASDAHQLILSSDDILAVASWNGIRTYEIDGTLRWTADVGCNDLISPVIAPDGSIYVFGYMGDDGSALVKIGNAPIDILSVAIVAILAATLVMFTYLIWKRKYKK
ncbi:MAG: hypothetical protein E4H30_01095 [Methanomassiliicoccus sp.]|nr:MAG: hypothetical protein E4H30_01095 [Methanomassiliicoccus sp.]